MKIKQNKSKLSFNKWVGNNPDQNKKYFESEEHLGWLKLARVKGNKNE